MAEVRSLFWQRPSIAAGLLVATWLASLAFAFGYAMFVPQRHALPADVERDLKSIQDRLRDKGSLSAQDMEHLADIAKRGEESAKAKLAKEGFSGIANDIRQRALWLSWVPWLLLAAWLRPSVGEVLVVGAGISGLLLVGLLNGAEAVVYSSVVLLVLMTKFIASRGRPHAP